MSFAFAPLSNILENQNQPKDSIVGNGRDFSIVAARDPKDQDCQNVNHPHGTTGNMMNPAQFMETLQRQFGSTEEFHQFERFFYSQKEEVAILRQNVNTYRSALEKIQDEKRKLELQLVSERASREQDFKNAQTELEKCNMQLNTQMYSIQCEAETWKRKAEATFKESEWLKEQLKTVELQKTDALRKQDEYARKNNEMDQYRACIEAYVKRQKETIKDIQSRVTDLEKVKDSLDEISEHTEKEVKKLAVHLTTLQRMRLESSKRIEDLENELITTRGELVQNNAELERLQSIEQKANEIIDQLTTENKDLMKGFNGLASAMDDKIKLEEEGHFLQTIHNLHVDSHNFSTD